jgi:hypothetical protein
MTNRHRVALAFSFLVAIATALVPLRVVHVRLRPDSD